ncbi:flavodoxin [Frankia sp. Cas8]|uniref:flavodoxin n=1 Tax=unclassified Frankia TaxID=2632575 RepID=UPI003A0FDBDB
MPTLLIVHHTPAPAMQAILETVRAGATRRRDRGRGRGGAAGALKHFFDTVYYPCLDATVGRPYAVYVHGNNDTTGAVRAVESIATGLRWKRMRDPVTVIGTPDAVAREACWELGANSR